MDGEGTQQDQRDDERKLVTRCLEGDLAAYEELIECHRAKVFAMLVQIVRNEEDAWDIAQQGFVKAWRSLSSFKGESAFFTWLFRIMRNLAIDFLRRKQRHGEQSLEAIEEKTGVLPAASTPASAAPDERAWQGEIADRIELALDTLSIDHREVIVMREIHGLSYQEIAKVTDCSQGTVMSRLFYARKKLQQELQDIYEKL